MRRNSSNCQCHVPCSSIKYEAGLSYAELSRQNTDRYLVPNKQRKEEILVRKDKVVLHSTNSFGEKKEEEKKRRSIGNQPVNQ